MSVYLYSSAKINKEKPFTIVWRSWVNKQILYAICYRVLLKQRDVQSFINAGKTNSPASACHLQLIIYPEPEGAIAVLVSWDGNFQHRWTCHKLSLAYPFIANARASRFYLRGFYFISHSGGPTHRLLPSNQSRASIRPVSRSLGWSKELITEIRPVCC